MKKFKEEIPKKLTGRLKKCLEFSNDIKNKEILNFGCSFGWFEKFAIENGCKSIIGIDIDQQKINQARRYLDKNNKVTFFRGTTEDLLNLKKNFDLVTLFDVIEHVPKNTEEKLFKNIHKILKSGGRLIISTPYNSFLSNILDPAWYFGHRHYSLNKLKRILNNCNFKVRKIDIKGGLWELMSMNIFYVFKWIIRTKMPFEDYFNKKRDDEYNLNKKGIATIFIEGVKK